jgi:hypothetical protein
MGKSGTGWLYDQLLMHPDFWMPPIKEIHYLNRDEPRVRAKRYLSRKRVGDTIKRGRGRPDFQKKEIQFLEEVHAARGKPMSLDFYASMFRFKDNLISGDVTPSYCAMPEDQIERLMARFPKLKIIMLLRDPVARAISHLQMWNRGEKVSAEELSDIGKFQTFFARSRVVRTGLPATFARTWLKHVPKDQFSYYFFEDLQANPEDVRRRIAEFLGADANKDFGVDPHENRKIKPKVAISEEVTDFLVEQFSSELLACADQFGGHAKAWPEKYGVARS